MSRKLLEFSSQPNMTLERSVKAAMTWGLKMISRAKEPLQS